MVVSEVYKHYVPPGMLVWEPCSKTRKLRSAILPRRDSGGLESGIPQMLAASRGV